MSHLLDSSPNTTNPTSPKCPPPSDDGGSCSTHSHHPSLARPHEELDLLEPPKNLALVEQGLYRSSLPTSKNFPFIRTLRLTTVIILSSEKPVKTVTNFFESQGIRLVHTGLHGWSLDRTSWKPIAEEVVKETLELILHRDNYPILMCDVGGVYHVGMVIGCLRRLQNWNLTSVVNEYRCFAASRTRYVNEQFIELFDIDLIIIPAFPPAWFVAQIEIEETEKRELDTLVRNGQVDKCGTLVSGSATSTMNISPKHVVYYYSSSSPLNSEVSGITPRIETL